MKRICVLAGILIGAAFGVSNAASAMDSDSDGVPDKFDIFPDDPLEWIDSDGDGIMDFDERRRFHTDPLRKDTDYDGVDDKNDIREYVFNAQHQYAKRVADLDNDGVRKELDPDNDGDLVMDGCEDSNQNGKYEPARGESDNFDPQARMAVCLGDPDFNTSNIDKSGIIVLPTSTPGGNNTKAVPE